MPARSTSKDAAIASQAAENERLRTQIAELQAKARADPATPPQNPWRKIPPPAIKFSLV